MILVTTGTQKFQFDRLIKAIDVAVGDKSISEDVFIQTGTSEYKPIYCKYKDFTTPEEMQELRKQSSLIITHGGTNSIIEGLKLGIPVIAIPRLSKYHEHVDDHQCEIVKEMQNSGLIIALYNMDDLVPSIKKAYETRFPKYQGGNGRLMHVIDEIIEKGL